MIAPDTTAPQPGRAEARGRLPKALGTRVDGTTAGGPKDATPPERVWHLASREPVTCGECGHVQLAYGQTCLCGASRESAPYQFFEAVDLSGLMCATSDPVDWCIAPLIPKGAVTLLGGHGGAGKTQIAIALMAHIACGRDWAGFTITQGRVLFVSLEDSGGRIRSLLRRIAEEYGLDAQEIARNVAIVDGTESDGTLAAEIRDQTHGPILQPTCAFEELQTLAVGFDLIVIDNASDAFAGNENERRQVRRFIRMIGTIARDNNAGVLLLAHVDKLAARKGSSANTYSGSTAWNNSVRSRLALTASEIGSPVLAHEKCNLAKAADPVTLRWTDCGVLIPVVLAHAEAEAASTLAGDCDSVLGALRAAIAAGTSVSTSRTGPATTQHVLQTFPALPAELCGKTGRDRFWSAVSALHADRKILIEDYQTVQRKPGRRWAIAPTAEDYRRAKDGG